MNKQVIIPLIISALLSVNANANSCKIEGYTIGFFNGVATTPEQAEEGTWKLESTLGLSQYHGEGVEYQLFYNDSYIGEGMVNVLGDFAETFDQRTQELDQQVNNKWEAFWDIVNGRQHSTIIQTIASASTGFLDLVNDLSSNSFNRIIKTFLESLASLSGSTPNTEEVSRKHRLINDSLTWEGKKLLYIAHSQGNLWVNQSYNHVLSQQGYDDSNIKIIHIAPASPTVNGEYILSGNDLVINGLQLTGIGSVQPYNFTARYTEEDKSGHGLIEVYLSDKKAKAMLLNAVNQAFSDLKKPDMEDYLFQTTFNYSSTFINRHEFPQFAIVDYVPASQAKAHENEIQYKRKHLINLQWPKKQLIPVPPKKALVFQQSRQGHRIQLTINECMDFPEESYAYLLGEFSNLKGDLSVALDATTTIKVRDRYGETKVEEKIDVSSMNPELVIPCAGSGNFLEWKLSKEFYTPDEKAVLKTMNLKGKRLLDSQYLSGVCVPH
ncbi:hypothetical protein [Photobacterium sanguinicancri]|uniref:hypothetical protein n=1 Tax=Photobacterium sanguinicancri TaxID=875932 RepID=UPI003D133F20